MRVQHFWIVLTLSVFVASTVVADEILETSEAIAKIEQLGGKIIDGSPRTMSVSVEPIPYLVIPFWAITIPLTLLAAYLLLSKPRRSPPKTLAGPATTEGN